MNSESPSGGASDGWLAGRCECGKVRYRVENAFLYASNCHCSRCRAATGSAFAVRGHRERKAGDHGRPDELLIVGEETLNDTRCRACGSLLFSVVADGAYVHVALGSLADSPPTMRPTKHIFVGSKAPVRDRGRPAQFEEHAT